jgi:hypothetical protein
VNYTRYPERHDRFASGAESRPTLAEENTVNKAWISKFALACMGI